MTREDISRKIQSNQRIDDSSRDFFERLVDDIFANFEKDCDDCVNKTDVYKEDCGSCKHFYGCKFEKK